MWGNDIKMKSKTDKRTKHVQHPNSLKNLVEIQTRPKEEAQALRSKGGKVQSIGKSVARKLDWMKRKGMTDVQTRELHDMLTNEDVSDLTILDYIKTLKELADDNGDFNEIRCVIELMLKWRKERFGSRVKVEGKMTVDWGGDVERILTGCKVVDATFEEVKDKTEETHRKGDVNEDFVETS